MENDQMFLDGSSNSFLGEVIGLVKVTMLHITIKDKFQVGDDFFIWPDHKTVRVHFRFRIPQNDQVVNITHYGRSYGECLRKIRDDMVGIIGQ